MKVGDLVKHSYGDTYGKIGIIIEVYPTLEFSNQHQSYCVCWTSWATSSGRRFNDPFTKDYPKEELEVISASR